MQQTNTQTDWWKELISPEIEFTPPNIFGLRTTNPAPPLSQQTTDPTTHTPILTPPHTHSLAKIGFQQKIIILKDGIQKTIKLRRYRCKECNASITTPLSHYLYENTKFSIPFVQNIRALYKRVSSLRRIQLAIKIEFGVHLAINTIKKLVQPEIDRFNIRTHRHRIRPMRDTLIEEDTPIHDLQERSAFPNAWIDIPEFSPQNLLNWHTLPSDCIYVFYIPRWRVFKSNAPNERGYHRKYIQTELIWTSGNIHPGIYLLPITRDIERNNLKSRFLVFRYNGVNTRTLYIHKRFSRYPFEPQILKRENYFSIDIKFFDLEIIPITGVYEQPEFANAAGLTQLLFPDLKQQRNHRLQPLIQRAEQKKHDLKIQDAIEPITQYFALLTFTSAIDDGTPVFETARNDCTIRVSLQAIQQGNIRLRFEAKRQITEIYRTELDAEPAHLFSALETHLITIYQKILAT